MVEEGGVFDIEKIAKLACLELTEEEKKTYQKDLDQVLSFFKMIEGISTERVENLTSPLKESTDLREDVVIERSDTRKLIEQSLELEGDYVKVPAFLKEDS